MDKNDGNPCQGGEPTMDAGDWRRQLKADSRERITNKILDTLKGHLPFSGEEGLHELKKIAVRFEEKIYGAATSQFDYLRKVSLKMLTMENWSQNTTTNSLQFKSAESSAMQPEVTNQGQLLSENIQSNIVPAGVQNATGLSSALPPTSRPCLSSALAPTPDLNMSALPSALPPSPDGNVPASFSSALHSSQGINMSSSSSELFPAFGFTGHHMSRPSDSSSALPPAFISLNLLANSQRQMQGWPQVVQQQQQQSDFSQQLICQQQLRQQFIQNRMQQHQQQQILLQKAQLSSSQKNQQPAIFQLTQSMLQQTAMPQQLIFPPQHQQQQLIESLDSTDQIGDKSEADWQEEVYQKIKVMKEIYLRKLSEIYQKNATKLQQLESLPQQPKSYQLEKLKMLKNMMEHLITVLQVSKRNISPVLKGKLGLYEKQIIAFINTNKPKKPDSSLQQGHLSLPHRHSMEHSESQSTQVQSHENQMSPQLQSMDLQGSVATMQQNNVIGLQQNSVSSSSGVSLAQKNMMYPWQSSSNTDPGQGNSLKLLQQVPVNSVQETPVLQVKQKLIEELNIQRQQELQQKLLEPQLHQITVVKDMDMNAMPSSHSGNNMLQRSIDYFKSNAGMVNNQYLKQEKEQKVSKNQLKNPYQQLLIQHLQRQADQQQHLIYFIHFIIVLTILFCFLVIVDY